ncbi:hypothetical protein THRCLA_22270 [Thraustotheca clavata]|uniref:Uncharacterized protein n=1 Tax=Thraustotheca clavata TaxID=74557 RepID=A0A1V9Z7P8_9STRA|nr:hypothetical protein THRCLA_22270 [Thraustotheca clavata]
MEAVYKRSCMAKEWTQIGLRITPKAQKKFDLEANQFGNYDVKSSTNAVAFVYNTTARVESMRRNSLPSFLRRVVNFGRAHEVYDAFGIEYHVTSFADNFYDQAIYQVLDDNLQLSNTITPPLPRPTKRGRVPDSRLPSSGERINENTRVYRQRCS